MANTITIEASLSDSDIVRSFEAIEKKGKATFDAIAKSAQQAAKTIRDALGTGTGGTDRLTQIRNAAQAKEALQESAHQKRLLEIRERAAKQQEAIEARKLSSLASIKAREEAAERRHQQRLVEIRERGATSGYGSLLAIAGRYLTITGAIAAATKAVNEAINLDSARRALTAVAGSAEAANQQLVRLREIAKLPGIDFEGAVRGATRLQAVGFTAAESERALRAFANAVALTGGSADQLREITVQLGQLASKGKVLSQDLRPIIEAAPAVGKALSNLFGTVDSKAISEQLEKLGKTSKDFIGILIGELERLPQVTSGPKEAIENLGISINQAFAGAGDILLEGLTPAIVDLTDKLDRLQDYLKNNKDDVDALKDSFAILGETAVDSFNAIGRIIQQVSGSEPLRLLKSAVDNFTLGLAEIRDLVEVVGAIALDVIKRLALGIEQFLQSKLALVGIRIRALDEDIRRLTGDTSQLETRIGQGNRNTRGVEAEIQARESVNRIRNSTPLPVLNGSNLFGGTRPGNFLGEIQRNLTAPVVSGGGGGRDPRLRIGGAGGSGGGSNRPQKSEREKELDRIRTFLVNDEIRLLRDFEDRAESIAKLQGAPVTVPLPRGGSFVIRPPEALQRLRERFAFERNLRPLTDQEEVINPRAFRGDQAASLFNIRDSQLRIQEVQIQNAIQAGVLTEVEGRKQILAAQRGAREELIRFKELQIQSGDLTAEQVTDLQLQIEQLKTLGLELDNSSRFIRGFGSEIEDVGDIFERFGRNVSGAFRNVTDLFNGLKNAVKNFFLDILGNTLQNLVRTTLGSVTNALAGRSNGGNGAGGGNFFSNLAAGFQNFRTPNFNPSAAGSGPTSASGGGFADALLRVSRGESPTSISSNPTFTAARELGVNLPTLANGSVSTASVGGFAGRFLAGGAVGLGPALLGLGLGAGLGGRSRAGQILGAIGGGAVGLGVSFGASVFGALGGGLSALGPAALAALGPAALIGAPLLIGAVLLGRARQRRSDEQASGEFLTQAIAGINALKQQAQSGQLTDVTQAKQIFEQTVLAQFIQQINTLKTASVRNSRLTNQVRDLRALFDKEVIPEIGRAQTRQRNVNRFVPEFHTGLRVAPYETFAKVLKNESIVTVQQRERANRLAGFDVLAAAGVPGTIGETQGGTPVAHNGGTYRGGGSMPIINMDTLVIELSPGTADRLLGVALSTPDGKRQIYGTVKDGRRNGEL